MDSSSFFFSYYGHWCISFDTRTEENLPPSENNQLMLVISWIINAYQEPHVSCHAKNVFFLNVKKCWTGDVSNYRLPVLSRASLQPTPFPSNIKWFLPNHTAVATIWMFLHQTISNCLWNRRLNIFASLQIPAGVIMSMVSTAIFLIRCYYQC